MQLIASNKARDLGAMLEGYECPAILVSADYEILATNQQYRDAFGEIGGETVLHLAERVAGLAHRAVEERASHWRVRPGANFEIELVSTSEANN